MLLNEDFDRAEATLRRTVAKTPWSSEAASELASLLRNRGRMEQALSVTAPFLSQPRVDHGLLAEHAESLKGLGRQDEALSIYRRAAKDYGRSAVARHNLAALLGDMARFREAKAFALEAQSMGLDAPQTWLSLARAHQGLSDLAAAEAAYRETLSRDSLNVEAHRELAQLIWMQTSDVAAALSPLDRTIRANPPNPRLLELKSLILRSCGDEAAARSIIDAAAHAFPGDGAVRVAAAHLAIKAGDGEEGLAHAKAAVAAAPTSFWTRLALCETYLGVGEPAKAAALANGLRAEAPNDQSVQAYQATAWRLLEDPRYLEAYDFREMVSTSRLDTPEGWSRLEDYLSDLANALEAAHVYRAHPFHQSLIHGTQAPNLASAADPIIKAFFEAVAGPIQRRLCDIGRGADSFRSRNTFATRFDGVWSVSLRAGGGRHVSHIHPKGWLSSACYIELPQLPAGGNSRQGWLSFGEPGVKTQPQLEAEYFVEPEPGMLVLFPSYFWHGTVPFSGGGKRLTLAFDLVPS